MVNYKSIKELIKILTKKIEQLPVKIFETREEMGCVSAVDAAKIINDAIAEKGVANAVHDALLGPVTIACPASILRKHKNAVLYLDKDSASKIL